MERRSNHDLTNFFNRITDVDALKSPFPRHLRQPVQNTPSTGAVSTRPLLNSAESVQRTARPLPGHGVPRWPYPNTATASGEVAVSPIGSTGLQSGGLDFAYNQLPPYRLPAGYPSSVQPVRARMYPASSDSRIIPGSTLPTHVVSPSISRVNATESGPQCQLKNWFLVLDTVKGHISVNGNSVNAEGVYVVRRSSAIAQIFNDRSLITAKGSCYKLVGPANLDMMRLKGFPEHLTPYFANGFPPNWRQLVDSYLGRSASAGYAKAECPRTSRSEAIARPSSASIKHNESFEEPRGANLPSSSGISGSTFTNQTLSPESPSVRSKAPVVASSVYSSGSSLFSSHKFARKFSPQTRRTSAGDRHETRADPMELREESEGDGDAVEEAGGPFASSDDTKPEEPFKLTSGAEFPSGPMSRRPAPRVSSSKENESDLSEVLGKPATPNVSIRNMSRASASRRRISRKVIDSSDELSGQADNSAGNVLLDPKTKADSESDDMASARVASRPLKQKATKDDSAKRTSTRRLSREMSALSPSVKRGNAASKESPASVPRRKSSPAKAAASTPSKGATRGSISRRTRSAQKEPSASDLEANDSHISEDNFNAVTDTGADSEATGDDSVVSTKVTVAAAEESLEDLRLDLGGDTDQSEEPIVRPAAASSVTPKRRARVSGQVSVKKVVSDSSDGDSRPDEESTKESKGEGQDPQELKTPRSGIKWKTGRRYFRYKEPDTNSSSITRSGRKVRKPQDWWANAQDHLAGSGNSHKESNIKYKWGSGDAMIVNNGKRMRLSDFYLQGGDESALFNEGAQTAKEGGNCVQSNSSHENHQS